jgi:hypothetical protein
MFHSAEQEDRIQSEQEILRSGKAGDANLCQYGNVSCVRCCIPHIGEDSYKTDSGYLGPGGLVMKFKNFNPTQDPKIIASQYEDSFPDVGREEMERRFSQRRFLFLELYDQERPRPSLLRYMEAAQKTEGYRYKHEVKAGPASMYMGGSVHKGEYPECQLLGFVDGKKKTGCMAHPMAETSGGYDGRDLVGFFHNTGCCKNVGCEASKEFKFLDPSAIKIFDKAIEGMSWYEYSRHSTSVLVYYLRGYDHLLQKLDDMHLLEAATLRQIVELTNSLYDNWPLRNANKLEDPDRMDSLAILSTDIPLAERIMYIALDTCFSESNFTAQLRQTRNHLEKSLSLFGA